MKTKILVILTTIVLVGVCLSFVLIANNREPVKAELDNDASSSENKSILADIPISKELDEYETYREIKDTLLKGIPQNEEIVYSPEDFADYTAYKEYVCEYWAEKDKISEYVGRKYDEPDTSLTRDMTMDDIADRFGIPMYRTKDALYYSPQGTLYMYRFQFADGQLDNLSMVYVAQKDNELVGYDIIVSNKTDVVYTLEEIKNKIDEKAYYSREKNNILSSDEKLLQMGDKASFSNVIEFFGLPDNYDLQISMRPTSHVYTVENRTVIFHSIYGKLSPETGKKVFTDCSDNLYCTVIYNEDDGTLLEKGYTEVDGKFVKVLTTIK